MTQEINKTVDYINFLQRKLDGLNKRAEQNKSDEIKLKQIYIETDETIDLYNLNIRKRDRLQNAEYLRLKQYRSHSQKSNL